jgi:hypothetical protein
VSLTRERDGRKWRIGAQDDVRWIFDKTQSTREIVSAIPPVFAAYATLVLPHSLGAEAKERHHRGVVSVLEAHSEAEPWWLGYLDTGVSEIVFPGVPMVRNHVGWDYVLVEAGPEQAAGWRPDPLEHRGPLPDLIFPANRSWLFSTLWDDDWSCIGGSEELISDFENHPAFQYPSDPGPRVGRVSLGEDATPPGHTSY